MNINFCHSLSPYSIKAKLHNFVNSSEFFFSPHINIIIVALLLLVPSISIAFEYSWQMDVTPEGQESYTPVPAQQFELLGNDADLSNSTASIDLKDKFNVYLSNTFSSHESALLLKSFNKLPYIDLDISYWVITPHNIPDDIVVHRLNSFNIVLIGKHAFDFSSPISAELDGVKGEVQSFRLFKSVVRYVTNNGLDNHIASSIIQHRYDIQLHAYDYRKLTEYTTGEDNDRFEDFKSEEIISLIYMLEQFPAGMLKVKGLKHIVRRRDGLTHPFYPQAPAIAWPSAGYIEFMESAFTGSDISYIHKLILHEKAHFLWSYTFDDQLRQEWTELGQWYQDDEGEWYTKQQTQFVSSYAHHNNPNEDMAESISYYVVNPDKLRNHAPTKYEFIRDRIMHGTRYVSKIREDLTFRVYNLWPDYVYPGKIISTHIQVIGEPEEDKKVKITFTTHSENENDYGSKIWFRLKSPQRTWLDVYLHAVDSDGNRVTSSNIFSTEISMSKYMASGYWIMKGISTVDAQGLWRWETNQDIGFQLYLNNPLEDTDPPVYIKDSMKLSISDAHTESGLSYQILTAQWKVNDNSPVPLFRILLNNITYPERRSLFGTENIGMNITKDDHGNQILTVDTIIADYYPGGVYAVSEITMSDIARNYTPIRFINDGDENHMEIDEPTVSIEIETPNPDFEPPELDLDRIFVRAEPYDSDNLNGKTIVEITFNAKDNNSGFDRGSCQLRSPDGREHNFYIKSHSDPYLIYFDYDTTIWKEYKWIIILPEGSPPGIWGLASMYIDDKAENVQFYDFTEIVRFDVDTDYNSAPQLVNNENLTTRLFNNFPNPSNPETWIPYQLSQPSNVNISIYNIDGRVVRRINVGYKQVGKYTSRDTAAYWDGRNDIGEKVSSGLYFYNLQTGDFSDTRRLIITK